MKRFLAITLTVICLVVAAAFFVLPRTANAAPNDGGQALEIAPPVLNLTANPGDVINAQIAIRDVSPLPLIVSSQVNDFIADPNSENGNPKTLVDTTEKSPYSIIDWVSPLPQMTLKSKQIENLPIKITVPKNAAPGGYYGTIRFTVSPPDMKETGVSLSASLGALIMIRVNGDANEKLSLQEFYVSKTGEKGSIFDSVPLQFTERIKNEGNVFEQPRGNIIIKDMFGNITANVNVNLENRNVLPNSTRRFEQPFDEAALGNRFMFGYYTAELTLSYGKNQTLTSRLSFWIIPWKLILGILILLTVLIFVGRIMIKRYNERLLGKSRSRSRRR